MLLPLLIATLMHSALIVPPSIPGCTSAMAGDDDASEQREQTEEQQSTFTVDVADELHILPSHAGSFAGRDMRPRRDP